MKRLEAVSGPIMYSDGAQGVRQWLGGPCDSIPAVKECYGPGFSGRRMTSVKPAATPSARRTDWRPASSMCTNTVLQHLGPLRTCSPTESRRALVSAVRIALVRTISGSADGRCHALGLGGGAPVNVAVARLATAGRTPRSVTADTERDSQLRPCHRIGSGSQP